MKGINLVSKAFEADLKQIRSEAVTFVCAMNEGAKSIASAAETFPERKAIVPSHPSGSTSGSIYQFLTNTEMKATLSDSPYKLTELFHADLIQHWHQFLNFVFYFAVRDSLSGDTPFKIPHMKSELNLSRYSLGHSDEFIAHAMMDSFSFLPYEKRFGLIRKILSPIEQISVYFKQEIAEIENIQRNVLIRNVLQHKRGKLTANEIRKNGGKKFECVISDQKSESVGAGQKVYRTLLDLEKLIISLSHIREVIRKAYIASALHYSTD